jgi:hypothetical protein
MKNSHFAKATRDRQKGSIAITVLLVLLIAGGAYWYVNNINSAKELAEPEQNLEDMQVEREEQEELTTPVVDRTKELWGENPIDETSNSIKVLTPTLGEEVTIGQTYIIKWENYDGNRNLNIGLKKTESSGKTEVYTITSSAPNTGQYSWKIQSGDILSVYKIEIHPEGAREAVGRSESFFITGEELIKNISIEPYSMVDASKPLIITGQARKVFKLGGEFHVDAIYTMDNTIFGFSDTDATCDKNKTGCNDLSGEWVDFEATLDLSRSPVCGISLRFYDYERVAGDAPFYTLPLMLYGIDGCVES